MHEQVLIKIIELSQLVITYGTKYKDVIDCFKANIIDEALARFQVRKDVCKALGITRRILEYNLNGNYKEKLK